MPLQCNVGCCCVTVEVDSGAIKRARPLPALFASAVAPSGVAPEPSGQVLQPHASSMCTGTDTRTIAHCRP
jgi:hypothetical protein